MTRVITLISRRRAVVRALNRVRNYPLMLFIVSLIGTHVDFSASMIVSNALKMLL